MGSAIATLFHELVYHPVVSLWIALICWIWTKHSYNEWDVRTHSLSIHDLVRKYQLWKIFTAVVTHSSWMTLLLNVSCVWNLKYLEAFYGSWFLLRYSILLIITEVLITYGLIQMTIRLSGNNSSIQLVLYSLQSHGCAGLVLAWLAFQLHQTLLYASSTPFPTLFLLFGFIKISPLLAPLLMTTIYYFLLGRNQLFSNSAGLLAGYLLSLGMLQILHNTYWTICIFLDLFIIFAISWKWQVDEANGSSSSSSVEAASRIAFRSFTGGEGNIEEHIEVLYDAEQLASLVPEIPLIRRSNSSIGGMDNADEGDEESQPLLAAEEDSFLGSNNDTMEGASRWRTYPESDELDISGSGRVNGRRLYIDEDV